MTLFLLARHAGLDMGEDALIEAVAAAVGKLPDRAESLRS